MRAIILIVITLLLSGCFMENGTVVERYSSNTCFCEVRKTEDGKYRIYAQWDTVHPSTGRIIPLALMQITKHVDSEDAVKHFITELASEPACKRLLE